MQINSACVQNQIWNFQMETLISLTLRGMSWCGLFQFVSKPISSRVTGVKNIELTFPLILVFNGIPIKVSNKSLFTETRKALYLFAMDSVSPCNPISRSFFQLLIYLQIDRMHFDLLSEFFIRLSYCFWK